MKRKTKKEFIKESKEVHGVKYDYSLVEYKGSKTKVKITCLIHGEFLQTPNNHLNGNGCPKCNGGVPYNMEDFIKKAKLLYNDKYDYSLVEYKNSQTKVKIICPNHGIFEQIPNSHLRNHGCPHCNGGIKLTLEQFINKSNKIHIGKYDYLLVDYKNAHIKIKIICKKHGMFKQTPYSHLNGNGCPKCIGRNKTTNEFIKESKEIHGDKYDYSLTEYIKHIKKIKIICTKHGIFEQTPHNHLSGFGCIKCNESKGELEIRKILENNNIKYISQKRFEKCKNINILPFDFYLPNLNLCIEYDGEQHYKPINYFGGKKEFKNIQIRDQIKNKYCKNNNIKLLRIKYNENILDKLNIII